MIAALRPRGLSDRLEQKIAALSLRERLQEVYYVPAASLFFSCCANDFPQRDRGRKARSIRTPAN
jgi:hypothetical protein